jgi:hypothetical protein
MNLLEYILNGLEWLIDPFGGWTTIDVANKQQIIKKQVEELKLIGFLSKKLNQKGIIIEELNTKLNEKDIIIEELNTKLNVYEESYAIQTDSIKKMNVDLEKFKNNIYILMSQKENLQKIIDARDIEIKAIKRINLALKKEIIELKKD